MRVLIVGCGYIGLPLGASLVERGHTVFGVRRRSTPAAAAEMSEVGLHPIFADITDPEGFRNLPTAIDWVVNTVASGRGGGLNDYRRTYLRGTSHLLDWLVRARPLRLVYTSSTSVYGQDDGSWVDEGSSAAPGSPTAKVLVETERLLLAAHQAWGLPAIVLRVAGIYGPGRGYWLQQLRAGAARVPGDGSRWMNMAHGHDIAGVIRTALERGRAGEIYNVCDDEPVRYSEFLAWLAGKLGRPVPPSVEENSASRRKRGLTSKRVSNRKLKADLGYALEFPSYREGYTALLEGTPIS